VEGTSCDLISNTILDLDWKLQLLEHKTEVPRVANVSTTLKIDSQLQMWDVIVEQTCHLRKQIIS